jgi:hypothetical protein
MSVSFLGQPGLPDATAQKLAGRVYLTTGFAGADFVICACWCGSPHLIQAGLVRGRSVPASTVQRCAAWCLQPVGAAREEDNGSRDRTGSGPVRGNDSPGGSVQGAGTRRSRVTGMARRHSCSRHQWWGRDASWETSAPPTPPARGGVGAGGLSTSGTRLGALTIFFGWPCCWNGRARGHGRADSGMVPTHPGRGWRWGVVRARVDRP